MINITKNDSVLFGDAQLDKYKNKMTEFVNDNYPHLINNISLAKNSISTIVDEAVKFSIVKEISISLLVVSALIEPQGYERNKQNLFLYQKSDNSQRDKNIKLVDFCGSIIENNYA